MDAKKKDRSLAVFMLVLVLGALFLWWVIHATNKDSDKVKASIFSYHATNPGTLSVEYRVTNTTKNAGRSDCSITMSDSGSTYTGYGSGYYSAKKIQPGETYSGIALVTVTNNGANYVTKGGITCRIIN